MGMPTIKHVRAFTVRGGGADYHDQGAGHWIDDHIATPMARYPEYRQSRQSFGINVLGTLVVEVEASDGTTGFAVTTGGEIGAFIVEKHLARFLEGRCVTEIEKMWDQMYFASLYYGRKGVVLNTISGVDLALWDLLAKVRKEPVYALLGGAVRDELQFYATGPRPDLAKDMGFIGGKMPLQHGPSEGEEGLNRNIARLAEMRSRVGPDFWLMLDCWMSLDINYATRLAHAAQQHGLKWIEEALPPDDYWGYAELRRKVPSGMLVTTGEHEATRWGFRLLLEMGCCDIIQPDVGWCGGLTELIKISALADAHNTLVVPHGSSVYSYHFVITRHNSPFAEFLMMSPQADRVIPMFSPLLLDNLEAGVWDAGTPANVVPTWSVPELPYMLRDLAHVHKVMDGPIGQEMSKLLLDKAKVRTLAVYDTTFRKIFTRPKAINSLADMKGLKIRVPEVQSYVRCMQLLGANPTPIPWGELYTSLETGVVQGFENKCEAAFTAKLHEQTKFAAYTGHIFVVNPLMVSDRWFGTLPKGIQQVVLDAAAESLAWQRAEAPASEKNFEQKMKDAGVTFTSPDPAPFRQAIEPYYKEFGDKFSANELIKRVRES